MNKKDEKGLIDFAKRMGRKIEEDIERRTLDIEKRTLVDFNTVDAVPTVWEEKCIIDTSKFKEVIIHESLEEIDPDQGWNIEPVIWEQITLPKLEEQLEEVNVNDLSSYTYGGMKIFGEPRMHSVIKSVNELKATYDLNYLPLPIHHSDFTFIAKDFKSSEKGQELSELAKAFEAYMKDFCDNLGVPYRVFLGTPGEVPTCNITITNEPEEDIQPDIIIGDK